MFKNSAIQYTHVKCIFSAIQRAQQHYTESSVYSNLRNGVIESALWEKCTTPAIGFCNNPDLKH